jgi:hypothetical protein
MATDSTPLLSHQYHLKMKEPKKSSQIIAAATASTASTTSKTSQLLKQFKKVKSTISTNSNMDTNLNGASKAALNSESSVVFRMEPIQKDFTSDHTDFNHLNPFNIIPAARNYVFAFETEVNKQLAL